MPYVHECQVCHIQFENQVAKTVYCPACRDKAYKEKEKASRHLRYLRSREGVAEEKVCPLCNRVKIPNTRRMCDNCKIEKEREYNREYRRTHERKSRRKTGQTSQNQKTLHTSQNRAQKRDITETEREYKIVCKLLNGFGKLWGWDLPQDQAWWREQYNDIITEV